MRRWTWTVALVGGAVVAVMIAGAIKFNIINDDVFLSGNAVHRADLVGRWVEPVPGQAGKVQGIFLRADGTAQSINMATLTYTSWTMNGGVLTLAGESCGNHTCGIFTEAYRVESLGQGTLRLLDNNGQLRQFARQKSP